MVTPPVGRRPGRVRRYRGPRKVVSGALLVPGPKGVGRMPGISINAERRAPSRQSSGGPVCSSASHGSTPCCFLLGHKPFGVGSTNLCKLALRQILQFDRARNGTCDPRGQFAPVRFCLSLGVGILINFPEMI